MKQWSKVKSVIVLLLILAATVFVVWQGASTMENIPLGLDLNGGVSITYQTSEANPSAQDMSDTIYKLQKRAENYSTEASVYQEGANRINIDMLRKILIQIIHSGYNGLAENHATVNRTVCTITKHIASVCLRSQPRHCFKSSVEAYVHAESSTCSDIIKLKTII